MTDFYGRVHGHYASGRPWGFGWHLTAALSLSTVATDWGSAVSALWTDATNGLNALYPTTTVLDTTDVVQLTSTLTYNSVSSPDNLNLAGTNVNIGTPDETAIVLSLRAATIGKGDRGRTKLPAPSENEVNNGELLTAAATRVGTIATAMLASLNGSGIGVFVFNRFATISKPVALTKTTISSAKCSSKLGTVRKRTKHETVTYH